MKTQMMFFLPYDNDMDPSCLLRRISLGGQAQHLTDHVRGRGKATITDTRDKRWFHPDHVSKNLTGITFTCRSSSMSHG